MAKLLLGKEAAASLLEDLAARTCVLKDRGTVPTLAVVRLGEKPSDLSYERGILKTAGAVGAAVRVIALPEDTAYPVLLDTIQRLNQDDTVHGVLLFRPLPEHLKPYRRELYNALAPGKDLDGMTDAGLAAAFLGREDAYSPCTPEACIALLDHYGYELRGKHVCLIGRSTVVGKPLSMLLLQRDATVTICHTKTRGLTSLCREADLVITAAGALRSLGAGKVAPDQWVLDVSMNYDPEKPTPGGMGGMAGDADFAAVEPIVAAITPVPGGIGPVTTPVLFRHLITATERQALT